MDSTFWHKRWAAGQIGFHEGEANALLTTYADRLPPPPARIFVPFCGKTRDIAWLLARGHRVVAAELSEIAIVQLFEELGVSPEITDLGPLKQYGAEGLDVFVGDMFDLTAQQLGDVDGVYDRAALVALPAEMRVRYAGMLATITGAAPQLLITFEYDQSVLPGPPFSVPPEAVAVLYGGRYMCATLETRDVEGGLKGLCPATETIWHLRPIS